MLRVQARFSCFLFFLDNLGWGRESNLCDGKRFCTFDFLVHIQLDTTFML